MQAELYPKWTCVECAKKYGCTLDPARTYTWHSGTCGSCCRNVDVYAPRDFKYPKDPKQGKSPSK